MSAWESLHFATLELARSTPIKQRLVCAYRRHLVSIPEDQLPGEVSRVVSTGACLVERGQAAAWRRRRRRIGAQMSNQEADDCATLIVEMFGITCRLLLNSARQSASVVQLHSLEREPAGHDIPALIASN